MSGTASKWLQLGLALAFVGGVAISFGLDFEIGKAMGRTFGSTIVTFLGLLPCAFLLIALFDVWVKRETVERHLGRHAGPLAYGWVVLLAGMTIGGLYLAFPVAYSLWKKGARLSLVFAYVNLAGVCRIPMMAFETSIMGYAFTATRLAVSIPLVIVASELLGRGLETRGYQMNTGAND